ncbi:MAG TPA: hypothetical protein VGR78_11810 [Verrucomicrobiae bacterium]|jgi:hypothetical protein|nr:hypothetical protein [Verrucomicrobiae bacterium]
MGRLGVLDEMKLYDFMVGIAEKRFTKVDLANYFRQTGSQSG